MHSSFRTALIAVFLVLMLAASKGISQCALTPAGDLEPGKTATGAANPGGGSVTIPGNTDAVGGETEIWVYPNDDATKDPCNIQWAVNNVAPGGKVRLKQYAKGTSNHTRFNFADPDFVRTVNPDNITVSHNGPLLRVNVLRPVILEGEFTSREDSGPGKGLGVKAQQGTTIWGGNYTLFVGSVGDSTKNQPPVQASVSIRNIRFDGAAPGPIKFNAATGTNEISGCSIVNYKFGLTPVGSTTGAFPIIVHPKSPQLPTGGFTIAGTLTIASNFIGAPLAFENLNNIMHISNADLALTIDGNVIEDSYWVPIAVWGNIGTTTITNNTIFKTLSRLLDGAGILVGTASVVGSPFFSDKAYDGATLIKYNKITVSSPNSSAITLSLSPRSQYDSAITVPETLTYDVSDNILTMNSAKAALACLGACSKTVWKGNMVKGTGKYGILVNDLPVTVNNVPVIYVPVGNYFEQNDLLPFTAGWAQVFVGRLASGNKFTHNCYGDVKPPKVVAGTIAGAVIEGDSNLLGNEDFHGSYSWQKPVVVLDNGAAWSPLIPGFASENNYVRAFHNNKLAICGTEVIDRNLELTGTTTNTVSGCQKPSSWTNTSIQTALPIKLATGTPNCPSLMKPPKPPRPVIPKPIKPLPPVKKR